MSSLYTLLGALGCLLSIPVVGLQGADPVKENREDPFPSVIPYFPLLTQETLQVP